jgi:transposase
VNKSPPAMHEQIKHLSHSQKLTVRQIAGQLHVGRKLVTKVLKEETICQCYRLRVEYLGQGYQGDTSPLKGWYREIQIMGDRTLNELNDFIQHVLGWDNTHLYSFTVHDKRYAFLGQDDYFAVEVVEDCFENHRSTKIPLHLVGLCENDQFVYNTDFGDDHIFLLTITGIGPTTNKNCLPMVIRTMGKDLMQYEPQDSEQEVASITEYEEPDGKQIHSSISTALQFRPNESFKVDFIAGKDKDTLDKWRRSKDKRRWEVAVSIFENRSMSPEEISNKIERPVRQIREWILAFNYYGMEGVWQAITRRSRSDKDARSGRLELRKKRLIEIIHHKPKYYGVNRSNWNLLSLAKVYTEQYDEKISYQLVSRSLKGAKYTIKKARRVLTSPDPDYREKVDNLLTTLHSLGPDELLFFIDELGPLKVRKYGGRVYAKVNEVPTYPQNQVGKGSVSLAGALSATTNQVTWKYIRSKDSESMIKLVEILYNEYYSKKKLYVTWDCASWHSSDALVSWLELFNAETERLGEGPIIEFIPLPTSSQFLDVIESVFSAMKKCVIHNSDYQSETEMKLSISQHFRERNEYFKENPKRVGKKIWEIDFFQDRDTIRSGTYREW